MTILSVFIIPKRYVLRLLTQLARAHTIQEHTIQRQAEESRRAREEAKKGGVAGPRLGLIQIDSDDAKGDSADDTKSP